MADRKITDLAELTSPVAADLLPIVVAAEPTAANKNKKIQYGTFLRNIPSGTVGAPSIAFTADTGVTGFFRSAANEIAFTTNSTFQGKFTTAGFQLGTGTAAAQLHLFSADTTDQVIIENTDAGLDTAPDVVLYRNSASPANNDNLGNLEFRGKDSAGNDQTYAQILSTISTVTNTSEVGILDLMTADAGASAMRLRLKGSNVGISESNPIYPLHVSNTVSSTTLQLQCTVNDASSGADITMYRRRGAATVGQNNDLLSTIYWRGHNNNATTEQVDYAAITGSIVDVTNNLEDGKLELKVQADGALTTEVAITAANTTLFGRPIIPTHTPASETATGTAGEIAWDNGYLYVCTATNTWKKVGISTSGTPGSTAAFSSGSAAAPSITFADDTNTGAFNPAADAFAITTGGTERLRITSAGRVGIGATTPSSTLTVGGNPPVAGAIAAVGAAAGISLALSDNVNSSLYVRNASGGAIIGTDGSGQIRFATNGNSASDEKIRIDSSGRLLVGTSTNTGGSLLQVNDNRIRIATAKTPASATDTGSAGEICWDTSYIYVCTATNTWKRAALSTW